MERKNKTAIVCSQHVENPEEFPDRTRIQQGQSKANRQNSVILLNIRNKHRIKITNRYQLYQPQQVSNAGRQISRRRRKPSMHKTWRCDEGSGDPVNGGVPASGPPHPLLRHLPRGPTTPHPVLPSSALIQNTPVYEP